MAKVAQSSVKYVVEAELEASGIVEKPDVVGAIFGQTEGILGEELNLRELQERGRIGRIKVSVDKNNGSSNAEIEIPSSLDSAETALIAACLETIERVGPTDAEIEVLQVKDQRESKRDYIVERAQELLENMESSSPDRKKINEEVKQQVRKQQVTALEGLEAGPQAREADEIIVVEGRADLMNLLRCGVKNVVAAGGTSIPEELGEIADGRKITVFVDGDRGGELLLNEFKQKISPDRVAKAPENKEVEELSKKEIFECLRDRESRVEKAEA